MKSLIFIYLITLKMWLFPGNFINMMDPKITVSLKIDSCISLNSNNKVLFIVSNKENNSFYLHAWYLFLTEITDEKGTVISPFKLEERTVPCIPEYILIPANKDTVITIETNYFNNYHLDVDKNYYIKSTYKGFKTNKKGKYPTLLKKIKIEKVKFKLCR
jgi:hypothetical protein